MPEIPLPTAIPESHTLPIVGAHYRPPAKALLKVLPTNFRLHLEPEPQNPYDFNAVRVLLKSSEIPPSLTAPLEDAVGAFGFTASEIFEAEIWHLGYLPREAAAELQPRIVAAIPKGEFFLSSARLTFDPAGRPQVAFHLPSTN